MRPPFRKSPRLLALFLLTGIFLVGLPALRVFAQVNDSDVSSLFESTGEDDGGQPADGFGIPTLRMLGALALVLGLILLIAYLARRFLPLQGTGLSGRADVIRIVATKMLGGRRSLMLVRVRGQTLLLGLTPQSIQCLTEIQEVEGEWAQPTEESPAGASSAFNRQLDNLIHPSKEDQP